MITRHGETRGMRVAAAPVLLGNARHIQPVGGGAEAETPPVGPIDIARGKRFALAQKMAGVAGQGRREVRHRDRQAADGQAPLVARQERGEVGAPLPSVLEAEAAAGANPGERGKQIRVAVILLATLVLWMTDSWHGVNAAWVGLVAAVILLMPGIGVVTPPAFRQGVDFGMLLFVVGALALGAMVNASGLGALLGAGLQKVLPMAPGAEATNFLSLVAMASGTGLFATVPGVPAVLTPMAQDLATLTGFSLKAVLMTQVIGFSTVFFPYQVGPLVVAMQLSGERLSHLVKVVLPLALLTLLVLAPLDFLWWKLLGWI